MKPIPHFLFWVVQLGIALNLNLFGAEPAVCPGPPSAPKFIAQGVNAQAWMGTDGLVHRIQRGTDNLDVFNEETKNLERMWKALGQNRMAKYYGTGTLTFHVEGGPDVIKLSHKFAFIGDCNGYMKLSDALPFICDDPILQDKLISNLRENQRLCNEARCVFWDAHEGNFRVNLKGDVVLLGDAGAVLPYTEFNTRQLFESTFQQEITEQIIRGEHKLGCESRTYNMLRQEKIHMEEMFQYLHERALSPESTPINPDFEFNNCLEMENHRTVVFKPSKGSVLIDSITGQEVKLPQETSKILIERMNTLPEGGSIVLIMDVSNKILLGVSVIVALKEGYDATIDSHKEITENDMKTLFPNLFGLPTGAYIDSGVEGTLVGLNGVAGAVTMYVVGIPLPNVAASTRDVYYMANHKGTTTIRFKVDGMNPTLVVDGKTGIIHTLGRNDVCYGNMGNWWNGRHYVWDSKAKTAKFVGQFQIECLDAFIETLLFQLETLKKYHTAEEIRDLNRLIRDTDVNYDAWEEGIRKSFLNKFSGLFGFYSDDVAHPAPDGWEEFIPKSIEASLDASDDLLDLPKKDPKFYNTVDKKARAKVASLLPLLRAARKARWYFKNRNFNEFAKANPKLAKKIQSLIGPYCPDPKSGKVRLIMAAPYSAQMTNSEPCEADEVQYGESVAFDFMADLSKDDSPPNFTQFSKASSCLAAAKKADTAFSDFQQTFVQPVCTAANGRVVIRNEMFWPNPMGHSCVMTGSKSWKSEHTGRFYCCVKNYSLTVTKIGAGIVNSDSTGISCGSTCAAKYLSGTRVTLIATPDSGYAFVGWSGACTGTGPCNITMSASKNVSAYFQQIFYSLNIQKAGGGAGTVSSNISGLNCGTSCLGMYYPGTLITLTATPSTGDFFTGWSGACTGVGSCTVTMSAAKTVTATFEHTYGLTVNKSGNGTGTISSSSPNSNINCGTACSGNYASGAVVVLTASPGAGSSFDGWSGACSGTGTCSVNMLAAKTVTAAFITINYSLTVTKNGTGTGTVSSTPSGISCGGTCSANYASGTSVTLSASATTGSTFAGWGGICSGTGTCTVAMSATKAVTATFNANAVPTSYVLTVSKGGSGSGTVSSAPTGINCGSTCSASFNSSVTVTLTASAAAGSSFAGWGGACSGTGNCTVAMSAARLVTATFNPNGSSYTLTIIKTGTGTGNVSAMPSSCTSAVCSYTAGTSLVLTPTAVAGSTFTGWSGDCVGIASCSIVMSQNRSVTANFSLNTTAGN